MSWLIFVLIFSAYLLTVIGVGFWRLVALHRQHLDIPNERSSHTIPTPSGGGIVIFFVTTGFLVFGASQNGKLNEILPFLAGAVLIAAISWLDDLYSLPTLLRFAVHTVAALLAIFGIGYFQIIELPFLTVNLGSFGFGQILTLIWIVGLTNAYNFMDGIDGIAGTQGLTAGTGWLLVGILTNQPLIILFGGLLAAACLGFLWHNWFPARIFMGDVGSAFLGYSFAVLPLLTARQTENRSNFVLVGIFLVWTFVFDAVLTFIRRAIRRENVFAAHRSHLYQRLNIAGFRHDTVTLIYSVLAILGVVFSVLWQILSPSNKLIAGIFASSIIMPSALWLFVRAIEAKKMKNEQSKIKI